MKATTEKGGLQGGVLSPVMWSLVVDNILRRLNKSGFTSQGYADDFSRHDSK